MAARSGRDIAREVGPLGYGLALAARAHRADLMQRLADLGLYAGQELIIVDLHENPGSTQAGLVDRMGLEQPTIAKAISRMERSGFVERTRDGVDRRAIRLRLTPQGEEVVEAVLAAWQSAEAVLAERLTADEREPFLRLLRRIAEA